jgi:hypothetical protein
VTQAEGVTASPSMMCRELQRLRLPLKKTGRVAPGITPWGPH